MFELNIKLAFAAAAVLALSGTAAAGQIPSGPAAVINGEPILMEEIERTAADELDGLSLRKHQFETQFERDRASALDSALEKIVTQRLLVTEAAKREVSLDELIAIEVNANVERPSDKAVAEFYQANQSSIQGSLEENATSIRIYLWNEQRRELLSAFVSRLKQQYPVKSFLEPPRTTIATAGRPALGADNAPVTIVEFSDFQCPFCRFIYPTLRKLQDDYRNQVRLVYMQFPLVSIHPEAQKAAEASLCAHEQSRFWELHDEIFMDPANVTASDLKEKAARLGLDMVAFNSCIESGRYLPQIAADVTEGTRAGVAGTPAMFINGRFLNGIQSYEEIRKIVDDELARFADHSRSN